MTLKNRKSHQENDPEAYLCLLWTAVIGMITGKRRLRI